MFAAVGTAIAGGGGSHRPRTTHEARASTATVPAPTSPPSTLPSAYPVTSGATGVQVKVPSGSVVTFTAVARCWLEATEGSGVVFAGILQPGATQSLTVRDVLSARVGNAQAVRITVGLRPAGLPDVGPNPLDIALTTHATT